MMRKSYLLPMTLLGAMLLSALPSQGADTHTKDKQQILAAYKKIDAAFAAKDIAAMAAPLAPDITTIDSDGEVQCRSKKDARENMIQIFADMVNGTSKTRVDTITFTPNGATVEETTDSTTHIIENGRPRTVFDHSTGRDLWVKRGNIWLIKSSRTLTSHP